MGTTDVAALLEAGEAGSEDGELVTGEPVSLLCSPPVVGTIDVAVLLEAGEAGGEDEELDTGELASLLLSPPVVGTIDVRSCTTRHALSFTDEDSRRQLNKCYFWLVCNK